MQISRIVCIMAQLVLVGWWSSRPLQAGAADFRPLFNGQDLSGWVNVNGAPETWSISNGVVYCTGKPTGALRTSRQYENFILEVEWRHLTAGGNSGIFIWGSPLPAVGAPFLKGIEVQVLDNGFNISGKNEWYTTHGDVFPIWGATMKPFGRHHGMRSFPSEERSKSSPEWNHYRITCTNGVIRLEVNGKEVSGGSDCVYRKGYLALESEGAPVEFRNLRLWELEGGLATAEQTAPVDLGWQHFFNHLDFRGWHTNEAVLQQWTVKNERLEAAAAAEPAILWATPKFPAAEIILDINPAKTANESASQTWLWLRQGEGQRISVPLEGLKAGVYQRISVEAKEKSVILTVGEFRKRHTLPFVVSGNQRFQFGLSHRGASAQFMNFFWRPLP
ncbi:DUF1080 domain-containing protein [Fontisphaera persica]|uniref:3-keto-disaccharide hydrolase n=1 Tax=Fontisphaera persica TaxID=2974023 RepID=UPI0024C0DB8D|nr:DUF1080 domain-containing protein [Fontisphaera persica]WCJ60225.1 DUF1080 domain-containing protein [Fontisphaera persica]